MSETILIRKMGVQPKLDDIEDMEQDPPPLSDIKTGYTPTTTASSTDIAHDFSRYENLDTPTPMKPSDLMAYTRFEASASTSTAALPPATSTETGMMNPERVETYEVSQTSTHQEEREAYPAHPALPMDTQRIQFYHQQPQVGQAPTARASYPQAMDYVDTANPYYFQYSFSLPTMGVTSTTAAASVTQTDIPATLQNVPVPTPVYTPLQPMRLGTHASFDQSSTSYERFDVQVNRRSVSVPQTLSCCDISPYGGSSTATTAFPPIKAEPVPGPSTMSPDYSLIKQEPFEFPSEMRRSSCSSLTIRPRKSLPTTMPSTSKEKQFICTAEGCEKRFARVDELKRHQRTHSDIRPYTCNICDKGFTRSDHLITHRRTHTGEKPYPCQYCERCFARSDERSRHAKTHTNPRCGTSTRGRRPSAKYALRKQIAPQQSQQQQLQQQQPGMPSGSQPSTSYTQFEMSGTSSDTSYSQSEPYSLYQFPHHQKQQQQQHPPGPPPPPPPPPPPSQ